MRPTIELNLTAFQTNTEVSTNESEEIKKNIKNHKQAARHHMLAAKYHMEAASHHEAGNYYLADQSSFIAQGHNTLAGQYQHEVPASLFTW